MSGGSSLPLSGIAAGEGEGDDVGSVVGSDDGVGVSEEVSSGVGDIEGTGEGEEVGSEEMLTVMG